MPNNLNISKLVKAQISTASIFTRRTIFDKSSCSKEYRKAEFSKAHGAPYAQKAGFSVFEAPQWQKCCTILIQIVPLHTLVQLGPAWSSPSQKLSAPKYGHPWLSKRPALETRLSLGLRRSLNVCPRKLPVESKNQCTSKAKQHRCHWKRRTSWNCGTSGVKCDFNVFQPFQTGHVLYTSPNS